jgi:hypothetical protein
MPSSTDPTFPDQPAALRRGGDAFKRWNRRLHYYLGLYLLFFVWLFAFTGLLLNHSSWKFAEFWDSRRQTTREHTILALSMGGDLAEARDIMRQLGIRGEVDWTITGEKPEALEFRASRPGHIFEIKADLARQKATVKEIDLNTWGVLRILHTFTGVRQDDERNQRDWWLTTAWAWAMDAVAIGLILMVLGSLYMWWELPRKRRWGTVSLALGFVSCGLFCVGLRWLF